MTDKLQKLTPYQHGRLRTQMYLGSTEPTTQTVLSFDGETLSLTEQSWVPALNTALREIIDNALDELVAHGHGDTLRVTYNPETMEFEIEDNGRGIPIDEVPSLGKGPAASILLGEAMAGRNFDERGRVAGLNGLGAALVNFTSEWFVLDIWRDGKHFHQRWTEGTYRGADVHKTGGPAIKEQRGSRRGTRVQFKPSGKVFKTMLLPLEYVRSRMWDIAVANPDLKVYFNGDRLTVKTGGRDPVLNTMLSAFTASLIETRTERMHGQFYVAVLKDCNEHIHSLVNNIPTFQGGSHVDEFRNLFYTTLIKLLEPVVKKELGVKKLTLKRSDLTGHLLVYNITRMDDPHFDSQSKSRLITDVKADIRAGWMESDVKGFLRKNPEWVSMVVEECRQRLGKTAQREVDQEQKKLSKKKIASLHDATGSKRHECVLFLAEGESAISGMVSARDARIHGGIGLRGKIMNVHGVEPSKVLASKALTDIMNCIGLKIGTKANPMSLRYGRIFICTDEDEDGKNITALIVNFLFRFWPELFQDSKHPYVWKFSTPLIILTKGKERKYIYADEYGDFNPDKWKSWQIIRAKGLARLTQPDWKLAIAQPRLIPITDDGRLKETLDLLFNPDRAADRQEWLTS